MKRSIFSVLCGLSMFAAISSATVSFAQSDVGDVNVLSLNEVGAVIADNS